MPRDQIHGRDESSSSDNTALIAGTVSGGVALLLIISIIVISVIAILHHRHVKGRQKLKQYNEADLSSLGGLLTPYD